MEAMGGKSRWMTPLLLLFLLGWPGLCQAAWSRDTELRLVKDFLDKSAPFGKVTAVFDSPVQVAVTFSLMFVLGLEERSQALTTSGWMELVWRDPRLAWNASQYEGISQLLVSQEQVWKPDLFLENTLDAFPLPRSDESDAMVTVTSSGFLAWEAPAVFKSSCKVDVLKFPFDTQVCFMNFSSFILTTASLDIQRDRLAANLMYFTNNNEWHLVNFSLGETEPNETSARIVYRLELQRRSTFHLLKLLLPTVLLAMVNCFVPLVPEESGERRSISLTLMLSWAVFLSFVGEMAPPNSDSVPLIAFYVVFNMAISALTSVLTMLPAFDRKHAQAVQGGKTGGSGWLRGCCSCRRAFPSPCCTRCFDYICFSFIVVLTVANTIWLVVCLA